MCVCGLRCVFCYGFDFCFILVGGLASANASGKCKTCGSEDVAMQMHLFDVFVAFVAAFERGMLNV